MSLQIGAGSARAVVRGWSGIIAFVLCVAAGISPPFPARASVQLQSFGVTPSGGIAPSTVAPQSVAPILAATPARDSVSDAVGATLATFRVDEAGNSSYSIPLQISPGVAGVAPKLSLSYNSRMPSSVMGPGWSISGVSQITRCRQTRESGDFMSGTTPIDGNPPPVNFTVSDRFCLDGARLLLLSGNTGAYGADGTTYSPETDPTTLVTAHLAAPTNTAPGPATFTVQRKDGTTSTYGNTTASASATLTATLPATGNSVNIGWNLARAQDSSGNYIDYLYTSDPSGSTFPFGPAAVESVLAQVNYTGHATSPVSSPFASVTFNYATQPIGQVRLGYQAGVAFLQSQQLSSVSVTNSGTTMRYYSLTYGTSTSGSGLPQLQQVKECRDSGQMVCFPPTTFAWSQANYSYVADSNQTGPAFQNLVSYKLADVDGDGRQDFVYAVNGVSACGSNSAIYVGFLDQTSTHQMTLTTANQTPVCAPMDLTNHDQAWYLLDYDGDGRADLLIGGNAGSNWAVYPSTGRPASGGTVFAGNNLLAGNPITVPAGLTAVGILADMNGDGLPDFITPDYSGPINPVTTLTHQAYSGLSVRYLQRQSNGSLGFSPPYEIILTFTDSTCDPGAQVTCTINFFNTNTGNQSVNTNDVDGDGRADLTFLLTTTPCSPCTQSPTNGIKVAFDPTIGTPAGPTIPNTKYYWYQFTANGLYTPSGGATEQLVHEYIDLSVQTDLTLPTSLNQMFVVDINGDGMSDLLYQDATDHTGQTYRVYLNTGYGYRATTLSVTGLNSDPATFQFADINGDGRLDLLYPSGAGYSYVDVVPSTGSGWAFSAPASAPAGLKYTSGWISLIGDFDGDGVADFLSFTKANSNNLYTSRVAGGGTCTSATDLASCSRYHAHDVITGFTNGYGATTTVAYQPLTNEGVYQRGGENTLNDTNVPKRSSLQLNTDFGWYSPVFDVIAPMYVVSEVQSSAPTQNNPGNVSTVYYAYTGALMQSGGRGFLGFFENLTFDANDAMNEGNQYMVSLNAYAQRYPFTGIPENSFKTAFTGSLTRGLPKLDTCANNIEDASNCFQPAGSYVWTWPYNTGVIVSNGGALPACNGAGCTSVSVSDCTSTAAPAVAMPQDLGAGAFMPPAVAQPVFPYAHITVDSQADLGGGIGQAGAQVTSGTTGYFCYDTNSPSHGNLVNSRTVTTDGAGNVEEQKLTANTFTDDTAHWYLGRLTHSDITFVRPNTPNVPRSTDFTYDPTTGLLTSEEVEKGQGANLDLLTVYTLDAYGNRTGAYQCNGSSFTTTTCSSTTGFVQQQSGTTVHRYAKTAFDGIGRYSTGSALPFYSSGGAGNLNEQTAITISGRDEFGNATGQSSVNGMTQTSEFGALGRPYFAADNTGKATTTTFRLCGTGTNQVGCSNDAMLKFRSQTATVGAPTTWMYFDVLGRPVVKIAQAFDNNPAGQKFTAVCTYADGHNRPVYQSEPFFLNVAANADGSPALSGASPCASAGYATTNKYDVLGRSTLITHPDGGTVSTSYTGLATFVTNPRHYTFETDKNALGEVVETRDPDVPGDNSGLIVDTGYDAAGNVLTVTRDALNNGNPASTTKIVSYFYYDTLGRKTSQNDPDASTASFTYNAAGDVISQTDAKNQTVTSSFDALGRRWKRTTTTGADGNAITDTWTFDAVTGTCNTGHSCGLLASEARLSTSGATFSRTQIYDSYGRPYTRNTSIAGNPYSEVSAYDGYGRPMSQQDASGYTLTTNYTTNGYVDDLTDSRVGTLYQVNTMTARGQVLQDERGNVAALTSTASYDPQTGRIQSICSGTNCGLQDLSYQFDKAGNLTQRERATSTAPTIEVFTNDALNRLKLAQLTYVQGVHETTPITTAQIFYDLLGNVCTKNGLSYSYAGYAGCTNHGSSGSPQAVTQVGATTYQYDGDGNQTTSNSGRTLVYNALNQLATASASTSSTAFQYGPDGDRFLRTDSGSAVPPIDCPTDPTPNDRIFCDGFEASSTGATQTTTYVGNVEIIKNNGTVTEMRRYLAGVAIDYAVTKQTRYLFADHLGSVDVIASSTGSPIEAASFDVHGSRRDPNTWQGTASPTVSTTHGFTGQEHVDAFEFIHFNGRVYDPALGRMLQVDPLTGPGNQSLNRYSYVINNPLSLTDPSGYSWLHDLDRIAGWITFGPLFPSVRNDYYSTLANPYVRMAGAIVAAYFTFGGASALLADAGWSSAAAAAGASAAAGFASGAIQSGTFEGGLYGAFSAELFFGIGSAFNGASWAHAGGTIGPTDLNAVGFTAKVLAHGIAGGALSSLQGGKFGDGFIGAGVSEALSPAVSSLHNEGGRVAVAALIGGTASRLSGGKFVNGAFSAAFGQLFNDEAHRLTKEQSAAVARAATQEKYYVDSLTTGQFVQAFPGTDSIGPDEETSVTMVRYQFDEDLGQMMATSYASFIVQQIADTIGDVPRDMLVGVMTSEMGSLGESIQGIYDVFSTAGTAASAVSGSATVYCSAQGSPGCIFSVKK